MPQPLQHRRGTTLPASLAEGEFFFKTDTEVWYSGPTGGGAPIVAGSGGIRAAWTNDEVVATVAQVVLGDGAVLSITKKDGSVSTITATGSNGTYSFTNPVGAVLNDASFSAVDDSNALFHVVINGDFGLLYIYNAAGTLSNAFDNLEEKITTVLLTYRAQ
jgi:hypothetical protein